jgi:hypothetical protein
MAEEQKQQTQTIKVHWAVQALFAFGLSLFAAFLHNIHGRQAEVEDALKLQNEKMIKVMENRHTSQDAAQNKAFLIDMVNTEARERVAQGTLLTDKIHNITLTVEKLLVMQDENSKQIQENSRQLSKIIGES